MNIKVYWTHKKFGHGASIFPNIISALEWAQASPELLFNKLTFLVEKEELDAEV